MEFQMPNVQQLKGVLFQFDLPIILAWPNLTEARTYSQSADEKPKFDMQGLIRPDHPQLAQCQGALVEAAKELWSVDQNGQLMLPPNFQWCLKNGDQLAATAAAENPPRDRSVLKGWLVLTGRSQIAPGLGAVINGKITQLDRDKAAPFLYGGVEVIVKYQFLAYKGGQGVGVTARPISVLSFNTGAKRPEFEAGAARQVTAAFSQESVQKYLGSVSAVDPTAGMPSMAPGVAASPLPW
jgi:hypothetical protein